MICCYEMRKGRGSCVEPSSLKNLGSMFDAEAIHAQIPSNIEPNYQFVRVHGTPIVTEQPHVVFGKLREDESRCNARVQAAPGRLSKPLAAIDLGSIARTGAGWPPGGYVCVAGNKRRSSRPRPVLAKNARRWLAGSGCSPRRPWIC